MFHSVTVYLKTFSVSDLPKACCTDGHEILTLEEIQVMRIQHTSRKAHTICLLVVFLQPVILQRTAESSSLV